MESLSARVPSRKLLEEKAEVPLQAGLIPKGKLKEKFLDLMGLQWELTRRGLFKEPQRLQRGEEGYGQRKLHRNCTHARKKKP